MSSAALSPHGRTIEQTDWMDPEGHRLREAQQAELRSRYGVDSAEVGVAPSPQDVTVFLVAREPDGTAVGCGALRQLDDTSGEIKRMYVTPEARGRGISREILSALEDHARSLGWHTLKLETGPLQPEAIGLYERAGYTLTGAFGSYSGDGDSLFYARHLHS